MFTESISKITNLTVNKINSINTRPWCLGETRTLKQLLKKEQSFK